MTQKEYENTAFAVSCTIKETFSWVLVRYSICYTRAFCVISASKKEKEDNNRYGKKNIFFFRSFW